MNGEVERAWKLVLSSPQFYMKGFESGLKLGEELDIRPESIIFIGMGGSGIVGDIVSDMMAPVSRYPLHVCKDYTCRIIANSNTLVVALSYSGNTTETLTSAAEAYTAGAKLIAITSGGFLDELAKKHGIPEVMVSSGMEARFAMTEMVGVVIGVFSGLGLAGQLTSLFLDSVNGLKDSLNEYDRFGMGEPFEISRNLLGRVAVSVGHTHLRSVAYRLKAQLNENAKHPSYAAQLPEAFHNEVEGWLSHLPLAYIIFRSTYEPQAISAALDYAVEKLVSCGRVHSVIRASSKTYVDEMLKLVALSDLISISLAGLKGVDPFRLNLIPGFRKLLSLEGRLQEYALRRFGG
ncbi:MAG: bifunctional phosphoglucose/phosphomannose isomerase [Nitrososphaerota archaeon]